MGTSIEYAELLCKSHYSFLEAASHPADLFDRAAELGYRALAITDRNGVYGMPKAYRAIRAIHAKRLAAQAGGENFSGGARGTASGALNTPQLIVGAELTLARDPRRLSRGPVLLATNRAGYGLLCRTLTALHAGKPKGEGFLAPDDLLRAIDATEHRRARDGLIALIPITPFDDGLELLLPQLRALFPPERIALALSRPLDGFDQKRTERARRLSQTFDIPIIATNDIHLATRGARPTQDLLTAIRLGLPLREAGRRLLPNAELHLKSPTQMAALFKDLPEAIRHTVRLAEQCTFSPSELRYRYPSEWIPQTHTAQSYLIELVEQGAQRRYPQGIPDAVRKQISHELSLIGQLGFADYFLTIWEIVEFAKQQNILCQGRGSAANSIVCYALGITAIDPIRMNLLFERFISVERGEPPDIDVDFENGRREEVLQHVYSKYGRDRAAMVANVITYRTRMATRESEKMLGEPRPELLKGIPRHLGIHSGGFTLSADPIIETVPVEPARMENRTVVQWDKDDLDSIGLLKVDLLALGMLTAMHATFDLVENHRGRKLTIATTPAEDPQTYAMIRKADTIGTFQIESRAQMSMLPRLLPKTFYDLVVQVAIVRPGPIQGGMVHPYLKRRRGEEVADYPHPALRPILEKTLGVPLFQEQVMKMAIAVGGFTPGEADQLRRAIGAWRSTGSIDAIGARLMDGLKKNGLTDSYCERIFKQIQGFAEYGFPESHAASFALIAYVSAYLKCHYPAEFACALLNAQPMGFYSGHTLVDDAKRHGVKILPLHPHHSEWRCTLEQSAPLAPPALRLGFGWIRAIREEDVRTLLTERAQRPFASLADFLDRTRFPETILHRMATADLFSAFGFDQRQALWEVLARHAPATAQLDLFAGLQGAPTGLFKPLDHPASIEADYRALRLSHRGHPMENLRKRLPGGRRPPLTTAQARAQPAGRVIEVAGWTIVRQHPHTAKGVCFATLEDECGFADLILHEAVYERVRSVFLDHPFLRVKGRIQRDGEAMSVLVQDVRPLIQDPNETPADFGPLEAHDFY